MLLRGASIDVGYRNLGIFIEEFDVRKLQSITNIPKTKRYLPSGLPTELFSKVLNKVYSSLEDVVVLDRIDLFSLSTASLITETEVFLNLNRYLDSIRPILDTCDFFVIEQQYMGNVKGKKVTNFFAHRLEFHIFAYLTIHYGGTAVGKREILIFPSKHKTRVLGAPKCVKGKKMTKPQRKEWSIFTATAILNKTHPSAIGLVVKHSSKMDDVCDAFLQMQAFLYMVFVDRLLY